MNVGALHAFTSRINTPEGHVGKPETAVLEEELSVLTSNALHSDAGLTVGPENNSLLHVVSGAPLPPMGFNPTCMSHLLGGCRRFLQLFCSSETTHKNL